MEKLEEIPQILNEPIFTQAFQTAKVANFSLQERSEYEKSRLSYIGIKQIALTAEEDGVYKGLQIAEAKAKAKEIALILEMQEDGFSIKQMAKLTKKTEEEITEIIKNK